MSCDGQFIHLYWLIVPVYLNPAHGDAHWPETGLYFCHTWCEILHVQLEWWGSELLENPSSLDISFPWRCAIEQCNSIFFCFHVFCINCLMKPYTCGDEGFLGINHPPCRHPVISAGLIKMTLMSVSFLIYYQ